MSRFLYFATGVGLIAVGVLGLVGVPNIALLSTAGPILLLALVALLVTPNEP